MLHHQEVIVTRASHQQDQLCEILERTGAFCIQAPCITLASPPGEEHPIFQKEHYLSYQKLIHTPHSYHLIIFTSVNAVEHFVKLPTATLGIVLKQAKISAVGKSTATALQNHQLPCHYTPPRFVAESLLKDLQNKIDWAHTRVLIPRALKARTLIENTLLSWGASVHVCPLYQTLPIHLSSEIKAKILSEYPPQVNKRWLTFTASSTVQHFVKQWSLTELKYIQKHTSVAVIGPIVAQTAKAYGFHIDAQAQPHTIQALVDCLF